MTQQGYAFIGLTALVAGLAAILVFAFLFLPIIIVVVYSFNAGRHVTELLGFSTKWYGEAWSDRFLIEALKHSLTIATITAILATVLGTASALAMDRLGSRVRWLFELLTYVAIIVPGIVIGIATLIFMAGIVAIPNEYFEAARIDGASGWKILRQITIPLSKGATATVIILSLIGGLRSFDIIWATTGGGPGFTSDVIASVIYKQYQAGFYGLSTAGNVVLFLLVTVIMVPLSYFLNRKPVEL